MKNRILPLITVLFTILSLTGCNTIGSKSVNLSVIYMATAVLSLLVLIGYCLTIRKKAVWLVTLFSCVLIVNIGYAILSVSSSLEMALMANRVAYLGSVFLPMSMLMIILDVTNTKHGKKLTISLALLGIAVFLIAASPGILTIYYKEVSFAVIGGISTLVKVYGPLHPLYLVYLLGYFAIMVALIIHASVKKTVGNTTHAVILAMAVFVNIGVWFIEQLCNIDFEFLSVSYITSELFLLGVHVVTSENQRLKALVRQKEETLMATSNNDTKPDKNSFVSDEMLERFTQGINTLTPTEHSIYEAYLSGSTTKEIMSDLNIKENTLKFHNKNLYGKLGVSSKKQLLQVHKAIASKAEKN